MTYDIIIIKKLNRTVVSCICQKVDLSFANSKCPSVTARCNPEFEAVVVETGAWSIGQSLP